MSFWNSLKTVMTTPIGRGVALPSGNGNLHWWGDGTGPIWGSLGARPGLDMRAAAGDVSQNSVVSAAVNWLATSWMEAPPLVGMKQAGKFAPKAAHPCALLLAQPAPDFAGQWLTWALLTDYFRDGNAYCHIVMGLREPGELQYLPARCIRPVSDAQGRLAYYEYKPKAGTVYQLDPARVVHFRFGVDPGNLLRGVSPFGPASVEIVSDNAAAAYPAHLLHHGGVPPGVLVPEPPQKDSRTEPMTREVAQTLKDDFNAKRRATPGEIPILSAALKLIMLGYKPSDMALLEVRTMPETRICAQIGIPPIVLNLYSGLQRSTFANMEEAKKSAWTDGIIPLQTLFASEWTRVLLPLFGNSHGLVVGHDYSKVGVLQEDMTAKRRQALDEYNAGLLTYEEARSEGGRDTPEGQKPGAPPVPIVEKDPPQL